MKFMHKRQSLIKCATKTASNSIFAAAEAKWNDALLCKIRGQDILAREVYYHGCCRREYTRNEIKAPQALRNTPPLLGAPKVIL